ncbi:PREDICTED: uncharacterized protein LOC108568092 isoform X2 [Nicrophorus vespilloides]|uniref:Uncharacterized protein LOC108568092 isoform X2 n=1 Tax=Nicrophorus vespilloides TaxID=110193 RepID=A0ABM1NCE7_NICVS|nr:PREDICTED: uncharacterized protein LOC108568092 isoform X2 [Nicrophorus vespilloides]XP_017784498.1 PREDICTED: uncharacterized protein LOC108568092 isoform X2 [Nicrophorus vespilloides]
MAKDATKKGTEEVTRIIMNEKVFSRMSECAMLLHPGFRSVLFTLDSVKSSTLLPATKPLGPDKAFPQNTIIFGIRLLAIDFHQIIGHMFYFQNSNMHKVADAIKAYIFDLHSCGFRVIATATSGIRDILEVLWELQLDYNETGFYEFDVGEYKKIVLLFDPSWLLRELNRTIVCSDVYFLVNNQTMVATNEFINEYVDTHRSSVDLADGKTTTASKLFSQSMARSLKETDISFFCKLFDTIFDSMNAIDSIHDSGKVLRKPYNRESEHDLFWLKCVPILKTMVRSTDMEIKCKMNADLLPKNKQRRLNNRVHDNATLNMRHFRILDYQCFLKYYQCPQSYISGLESHLRKLSIYWDTLNNVCNSITLQIHIQITKIHQLNSYKRYPPVREEKLLKFKSSKSNNISLVFDDKGKLHHEDARRRLQSRRRESENMFLMYDGPNRIDEVTEEKKMLVNKFSADLNKLVQKYKSKIEVNEAKATEVESNENIEININDFSEYADAEKLLNEKTPTDDSSDDDDEFGPEKDLSMFVMYGGPKLKINKGTSGSSWFFQNVPFTALKGIDKYDDLECLLQVVMKDKFLHSVKGSSPKAATVPKKKEDDVPKYIFKNHYIRVEPKMEPAQLKKKVDPDQKEFMDLLKSLTFGDKTQQEVYMGVLATLKENIERIKDYNEEQLGCLSQEVLYLQGSIQKILETKHLISTTLGLKANRTVAAIFKSKAHEKFLNLSVFDMWINTIKAMKEVFLSLTCFHVPTLCTKRVNCDLMQEFIYKLKVANGVSCAINIVEPQVGEHLDEQLSRFALTEDCSYTVR